MGYNRYNYLENQAEGGGESSLVYGSVICPLTRTRFVLTAVMHLIKMADTKVNEGQMQNISQHIN